MQALKYSLRLVLCWPVLVMLGGIVVIFIALALIASLFMASLTLPAALLAGAKFGGIFAGALWAMFFIKTFTAVSAGSGDVPMEGKSGKTPAETEENATSTGDGGKPMDS